MMLRRRILDKGIQKYGTADYSIINKTFRGTEREYLPFNLLDGNLQAFSILFNYKITQGYTEDSPNINVDVISCNETASNFTNALRIGRFGQYAYDRLFDKGIYRAITSENRYSNMIGGIIMYIDNGVTNVITIFNTNQVSSITTENYYTSANNVSIGGANGSASPTNQSVGIIEQAHFYFKALTSTDLVNWFENGIVP